MIKKLQEQRIAIFKSVVSTQKLI
jgi:hypothetical protein